VDSFLFVNPVLFLPDHPFATRYYSNGASFIERAGFRAIAKRLESIPFVSGVPMVDDHFNWHFAAP
jgi:hypothetical protein